MTTIPPAHDMLVFAVLCAAAVGWLALAIVVALARLLSRHWVHDDDSDPR